MNYEEDVNIYSEEVQEVLGTSPKWIVRWGTTVCLLSLILMGWLAWIFKYPEKVEAPITITSAIPPTDVIAQESGYISQLLKENNDTVRRGDLLGIINSTTDYEDVIELEQYLDNFNNANENSSLLDIKSPKRNLVLGEALQRSYSGFIQANERYNLRVSRSSASAESAKYRRQIEAIQKGIEKEGQRIEDTRKRIRDLETILLDKQDKLTRREIPQSEVEQTSGQITNARRIVAEYDASIADKKQEINRIRARQTAAIRQLRDNNSSSYIALTEQAKQLKSQIDDWKQSYVLSAPAEGIVTYFGSRSSAKRYVERGDNIMAIIPLDTMAELGRNEIIGKVFLPIKGSGKVKKGQKVKVKLDSYPAHEYGIVEGEIIQKARLPRNSTYTIEVQFPKGLNTNFSSEISFDQRMTGTATIITQQRRFAERILEKFIDVFEVEGNNS